MTSLPRKQRIEMHLLPNIPKSKGNQTMKHSQLIEYNITYAHFSRKIT